MHERLMFWHVDERQYNVDELFRAADTIVEKARERGVSSQDEDALREAKKHMSVTYSILSRCMSHMPHRILAANDNLWRAIQTNPTPEIPFVFTGIPQRILEVWSQLSCTDATALSPLSPTSLLMFPLRLVKLRDIVLARPFIDEARLVDAGHAQAEEEEARNLLFLQSVRKKAKGAKRRVAEENVRETRKAEEAARQRQDKVLEMQNELRIVTEKLAPKSPSATQKDKGEVVLTRTPGLTRQTLMSKSPLANAHMLTSRSSKLNYLLKEVRLLSHCVRSPLLIYL
jgi:hypothetical protein